MADLSTISGDIVGLARVCGPATAARWVAGMIPCIGDVVRRRNLQPVDAAMGDGPFTVRLQSPPSTFRITGPQVFSGIREMYVRDVYSRRLWPATALDDVVVDLGANVGNFCSLVLGSDPGVRVVAVEPSRSLNTRFVASLGLNDGFLQRAQLIRGFVGRPCWKQDTIIADDPEYAGAIWITEDDLIERAGLHRISLLKCDIEGSEFGLLGTDSRLLAMTSALACEVHSFAGDVTAFVDSIRASGFSVDAIRHAPDGSATMFATRTASLR